MKTLEIERRFRAGEGRQSNKKDLYCFQCSLQFDKKTIYDMHLKIIHNYVRRIDDILPGIKRLPENEVQIESNISATSERTQSGKKTFGCTLCYK